MQPTTCSLNCTAARTRRRIAEISVLFLCLLISTPAAAGRPPAEEPPRSLADLTIEELMNEPVTSVSKKETRLIESAAAVAVITQEDIRQAGVYSLPEALRLVPGVNVARINANQWAVSARGFIDQYANKLLVLVDGRSIYTPTFAGVYWDVQDLTIDDLDRIEVVRGPGATLWGANAVNGVINIITKRAGETQGTLAKATCGNQNRPSVGLRHGGPLGHDGNYRIYLKYFDRAHLFDPEGVATPDDWQAMRGGFRFDSGLSAGDNLTVQGDYYEGDSGQAVDHPILTSPYSERWDLVNRNRGGHVLGRWTRILSPAAELCVQLYYDRLDHSVSGAREIRDTYDFDLQHRFSWGRGHDTVWGAGYRYSPGAMRSTILPSWSREGRRDRLLSAFLQDEIALAGGRLHVTLGSKFEHNGFTGFEYQPSGTLLWAPTARQRVWLAMSRAVRTPSRAETDARYDIAVLPPSPSSLGLPVLMRYEGNPDFASEELLAYELGYRVEPTRELSLDVATFFNAYRNLRTYEAEAPVMVLDPPPAHLLVPCKSSNDMEGDTYGAEVSLRCRVTRGWRIGAGYTWLHMRLPRLPLPVPGFSQNDSPQHQFHLRSSVGLPRRVELNGVVYYVDCLPQLGVPAYVRGDLGLGWRPLSGLDIHLWGRNLFDRRHLEFTSYHTLLRTEIPREVGVTLTWDF